MFGLFTHPGHAFVPQNVGFVAPMALQKGRAFTPRANCAILDKDNFAWKEADIEERLAGVVPAKIGVDKSSVVKDLINLPPDMVERGDVIRSYQFEPGTKIALHQHPESTLQVVMQGFISVKTEGESKLYMAGDMYVIPANVPYELKVPGPDEGVRVQYRGIHYYGVCNFK